jgi:endonuclease III
MGNVNFELKILDEDLRKVGFWKFRANEAIKFLNIINDKYNLGFKLKEVKKSEDKDLDWIK